MAKGLLRTGPSLADTAYHHCIDLWVVFMELDHTTRTQARSPFWRFLKPGFRHVECWKFIPPGAWLRFNTGIELIAPEVYLYPPWELQARLKPTAVKVQRLVKQGFWREPLFFGPVTCVEQVKAFLGLRNGFIRTPYQLYKELTKHEKRGFGRRIFPIGEPDTGAAGPSGGTG